GPRRRRRRRAAPQRCQGVRQGRPDCPRAGGACRAHGGTGDGAAGTEERM
ncbi:MAG: hypothetical protein AVDCRST_MAG01-01-5170, partial [uncultured Rubrobacteraceae bacterium]